jgi:hemerythrin-like domain-containing protein
MMNAIKLLEQQHQDVRDLFERIDQADATSQRESLVQELADNLAAHMTIEESIFYPAAYTTDDTKYTESVDEHAAAKRTLCELLQMSCEDENFDDKMTKLQEQVESHIDEEEAELFKAAKQELEAEELERLGDEMKQRFDEEMAGQPGRNLVLLTGVDDEDAITEVELDPNAEAAAAK